MYQCYHVCSVCKNIHDDGKVPDGTIFHLDPPVVCSYQASRDVAGIIREDAKSGRSLGWNPVRAERSRLCFYAFVEMMLVNRKGDHQNDLTYTCDSLNCLSPVSSVNKTL